MLPKAVCPSCVESLMRQGITHPVVEFSKQPDGGWKCNNCWYYATTHELQDLVRLQNQLEAHERDRVSMIQAHMMGNSHASTAKNR